MNMTETVERWKRAASRYVPGGVTRRSLTCQASYFGSEITNFLEGEPIVDVLKQAELRINFSKYVFLNRDGIWRCDGDPDRKEPSTAYDAAFAALCSGQKDPFQFLIDELARIAGEVAEA